MSAPHARRWQSGLLAAALAVPSVALVVFGLRAIGQERQLAQARVADDDRLRADRFGADLTARLERIKLEEAGALARAGSGQSIGHPHGADVVLIGWIREGRLILPWDVEPDVLQAAAVLRDRTTPYARALAEADRLDYVANQPGVAAMSYSRAAALGATPFEKDWASFLEARAHLKCHCPEDAQPLFDRLLTSSVVDDQGVPIALWTASMLLEHQELKVAPRAVFDAIERAISRPGWHSPAALAQIRDLLARATPADNDAASVERAGGLKVRADRVAADIEQALSLQRDLLRVIPVAHELQSSATLPPEWTAFGTEAWFVGVSPSLAGLPPFLIAVRAEPIVATIGGSSIDAASSLPEILVGGTRGRPLEGFPGVRLLLPDHGDESWIPAYRVQRTFYLAALGTVLMVTLAGGYIVHRNVRRELQLAELRSQFVASVSHELKTPLTAIRMFAETLQMDRPFDPSTRTEYLNTIVNESERLTRLINNVLDYSKIERGEKVYRLVPSSLAAVAREAAAAMQYPLAKHGFHLHVDVADDLPPARLDADAIEQAILNLLSNAMKYSKDSRDIVLAVTRLDGHVVLSVRDQGLGIPLEEQSRIFERFYRVSTPENGQIPGTGLGLALVDHIVRAHGGFVRVTSAPGEGSTFAIHLPLESVA